MLPLVYLLPVAVSIPAEFDCEMRKMALQFAIKIQPRLPHSEQVHLAAQRIALQCVPAEWVVGYAAGEDLGEGE